MVQFRGPIQWVKIMGQEALPFLAKQNNMKVIWEYIEDRNFDRALFMQIYKMEMDHYKER